MYIYIYRVLIAWGILQASLREVKGKATYNWKTWPQVQPLPPSLSLTVPLHPSLSVHLFSALPLHLSVSLREKIAGSVGMKERKGHSEASENVCARGMTERQMGKGEGSGEEDGRE
jgi:hypothetical protein